MEYYYQCKLSIPCLGARAQGVIGGVEALTLRTLVVLGGTLASATGLMSHEHIVAA